MADQDKNQKHQKAQEQSDDEGILKSTAKAIGSAAGKVVAMTGIGGAAAAAEKPAQTGRLQKKHKERLPRRQKKAQKKTEMAEAKA